MCTDQKPLLKVLYQDDCLAVVSKPEKLLTHRTEIANGDQYFALQLARDLFGKRVWPLYRLDRGTSGALMFAFDPQTVSALAQQTHETFQKQYFAIVRGTSEKTMLIDHALKPPVDPYLRVQKTEAQEAKTLLTTLASAEVPVSSGKYETTRLSLVKLELLTGRRHQIRRHMKFIAHPIIGDATYGKGPLNRALAEYFGRDRLYLHCCGISFLHPRTGTRVSITDRLDGDFAETVKQLRWVNCI